MLQFETGLAPRRRPAKYASNRRRFTALVDFNRNCRSRDGVKLPPHGRAGLLPALRRCGFLFTDAFDDWSQDDFKTHIYNGGTSRSDPGYLEVTPARQCRRRGAQLFGAHKATLRVLDFGGGNDVLCGRAAGGGLSRGHDL